MATVETRRERQRGCGWRKEGGIYLVNDGPGRSCGRLPFPLHVCPTCNQGIKPARGWTWIDGVAVLAAAPKCKHLQAAEQEAAQPDGVLAANQRLAVLVQNLPCETCPFNGRARSDDNRVGLMWVGGNFYPTSDDFVKEAREQGLSKRISQIPKELVIGKTWVWLAHRSVIPGEHTADCLVSDPVIDGFCANVPCTCDAALLPGVFHAFVPTRIEYVVKGTEPVEELDALEKRGLTLVKVERIGENIDLPIAAKESDDDGE